MVELASGMLVDRAGRFEALATRSLTMLHGPRGSGKSVVMHQLAEASRLRGLPVRIAPAAADGSIVHRIAAALACAATGEEVRRVASRVGSVAVFIDDACVRAPDAEFLASLLQDAPLVRWVVALRGELPGLERIPAESLGVIGFEALGFTRGEVAGLSAWFGRRVSDDEAALIAWETSGWCALVVKVLERIARYAGTPTRVGDALHELDEDLTSWSLGAVVHPKDAALLFELSIAALLDEPTARFLTGDATIGHRLDQLVERGLLLRHAEVECGTVRFGLAPGIHRIVLAAAPSDAAFSGERSVELARWLSENGRPVQAFGQAVAGEHWLLVAELMESSWGRLAGVTDEILIPAVRSLPHELVQDFPIASAIRNIVMGTPLGADDVAGVLTPVQAGVPAGTGKLDRGRAVERAVSAAVVLRRAGRFSEALGAARAAERLLRAGPAAFPAEWRDREGMARLQLALVFEFGGWPRAATVQLRLAQAAVDTAATGSRAEAFYLAAVRDVKAQLEGRDPDGLRRRAPLEEPGNGRLWFMPYRDTVTIITGALRAVDALDRERAQSLLAELRLLDYRDEFWFWGALAQARFDALWSDAGSAEQHLRRAIARRGDWFNEQSIAIPVLLAAEVDSLLAHGQATRARQRVSLSTTTHPRVMISRARICLATGEAAEALDLVTNVLVVQGLSPRDRLDAALLRAAALQSARAADAAQAWSAVADLSAALHDPWYPFALIPDDLLVEGARVVPRLRDPVDAVQRAELGHRISSGLSIVALTRREQSVVESLAAGMSVAAIARANYVSLATVKSQLRSLYKKLGVHTRDEAVAEAEELGLL
jgi:LuxR family maltose regulon positive regulatory protein